MNVSLNVRSAFRELEKYRSCFRSPGICRWPRGSGRYVAASLLVCGVHSGSAMAKEPPWWSDPKTEDSEYRYFVASAAACQTEQEARDAAFLSAQKNIASQLALDTLGRFYKTSLAGVDVVAHPTEHDANGWACWIMVSYPQTLYNHLVTNTPPPTSRHKVLVAPFAFDSSSQKDFAPVIENYKKQGYGLGLWLTIADALYDSLDFEPDTRPSKVTDEITAAVETGAEVTGDIPEYLLIPNASFSDFEVQGLHNGHVTSSIHHHASVCLKLYYRESGRWRLAMLAQEDKVDSDEKGATNAGARLAVQKLLDRWHAKRPTPALDQK
jgi:hypothetical protein